MLIFSIFIITLLLGVPIFAVMGLSTTIPLLFDKTLNLTIVPQTLFSGADQYVLIAVALFIVAGVIMETAGMTNEIFGFANAAVGWLPGGLGAVVIFACMIFAALSGSGMATVVAVGSMTVGSMLKNGYSRATAGAIAASGGCLGVLIPPSNPMILYGVIAGVSVSQLFIAGVVPGVLIGLGMILICYLQGKKYHLGGMGKFSILKFLEALWKAKFALLCPVIIIGGIYSGFATPTEAAELALIYAMIYGFIIKRSLKVMELLRAFKTGALTSSCMLAMGGVAIGFGRLLTIYNVPQTVASFLMGISNNPQIVLMLILAFLIFVGTWMETLAQVIILTPIFLPVITRLGINPIHFGVLMVLACDIGFLTPPVGGNLFAAVKLVDVTIEKISLAEIPFILLLIGMSICFIYFPQISLWLPNLMRLVGH